MQTGETNPGGFSTFEVSNRAFDLVDMGRGAFCRVFGEDIGDRRNVRSSGNREPCQATYIHLHGMNKIILFTFGQGGECDTIDRVP